MPRLPWSAARRGTLSPAAGEPPRAAVAAVLLVAVTLAACGAQPSSTRHGPPGDAAGGEAPGATVPDATAAHTTLPDATVPDPGGQITAAWLAAADRAWRPEGHVRAHALIFSPTFSGLGYDNPTVFGSSLPVLRAEESMLEATGAQAVSVDLGYDPWLEHDSAQIAEDDELIHQIRASGHQLMLKDAAAELYRTYPLPWAQFATAWVQRVRTLAARYHPTWYTVIKEPSWYLPMVAGVHVGSSDAATTQFESVSTWTSLLSQLVAAVHQVSPATKVGVSVPGDFLSLPGYPQFAEFLRAASHTPGVAFIGFDDYDALAFNDTVGYLHRYGTAGRAVWIDEAWSAPLPAQAFQPGRGPLDAAFLYTLTRFALFIGAQGVSPFYTDAFASYGPRPTGTTTLLRYYQGRTPAFDAFRHDVTAVSHGQVP